MIKAVSALFYSSPAGESEEGKIRDFLIQAGADRPTASKWARSARKNGWTSAMIDTFMEAFRNESYLRSKGISLSMAVSPDTFGSPVAVHRDSRTSYTFALFLGNAMGVGEGSIEAAMTHEMRHVRVSVFLDDISEKYPGTGRYDLILKEGSKLVGRSAGDIVERFISRLDEMSYVTSREEAAVVLKFIYTLIDEEWVWANATKPELTGNLFQNSIGADKIEGCDQRGEALLILGLAHHKCLSDRLHVPMKNIQFEAACEKYKNNPLFIDTYAFFGLCFDISRAYFPK